MYLFVTFFNVSLIVQIDHLRFMTYNIIAFQLKFISPLKAC